MALEGVRELREKTGAGLVDCQKALAEASGDLEKALRLLRERGLAKAAKKTGRAATDGTIGAYIHPGGKIGVFPDVVRAARIIRHRGQMIAGLGADG